MREPLGVMEIQHSTVALKVHLTFIQVGEMTEIKVKYKYKVYMYLEEVDELLQAISQLICKWKQYSYSEKSQ